MVLKNKTSLCFRAGVDEAENEEKNIERGK